MSLPPGVRDVRRIGGGDINEAFRVVLADGSEAFVKTRAEASPGEYAAEADGLRWLAEPGALRTPGVLAVDDGYLVLEWITPGRLDAPGELRFGLARLGLSLEVVLTSPLVRARQTAEILAAALDPRPSLVNVDSLAPDGTHAALVADLEKHARKARIALVGHEPMIGKLAATLLISRHPLEFKKGAVCRVDVEDLSLAGPGDLRWMLTPKILRALKK